MVPMIIVVKSKPKKACLRNYDMYIQKTSRVVKQTREAYEKPLLKEES